MSKVTARELRLFLYAEIHLKTEVILYDSGNRFLPTCTIQEDTTQPNAQFFAQQALQDLFGTDVFRDQNAHSEIIVREKDPKKPGIYRGKAEITEDVFREILKGRACEKILTFQKDLVRKLSGICDPGDIAYMEESIFGIR